MRRLGLFKFLLTFLGFVVMLFFAGCAPTTPDLAVMKVAKKNYFKIDVRSISRTVDEKDDLLIFDYEYRLNYVNSNSAAFNVVVKAKPGGASEDKYRVIYNSTIYFQNGYQGGALEVDVPKNLRSYKTLDVILILTPKDKVFGQEEYVYKDTATIGATRYKIF